MNSVPRVTFFVLSHQLPQLFLPSLQRATNEELEKIKKHHESSKEDEVKLLDKPEQ